MRSSVNLTSPWRLLWAHRSMLCRTVHSDVMARYAGSLFSKVWLVLNPLTFMTMYTFLYYAVFRVQLGGLDTFGYALLTFSGLLPILAFNESIGTGTSSVTANANLVKNTLFPIDLIPVKAVMVAQAGQIVGLALLLGALAVTGRLHISALILPIVVALQVAFTIGLVWILSSIHVFMRDVQQVVVFVMMGLMVMSPIGYTRDTIPLNLRQLSTFNPLYHVLVVYQDALLFGRLPGFWSWVALCAGSVGTFCFGYWFFSRLKVVFDDYL